MKLEFDSLADLNDFLQWADGYSGSQNVTVRIPASAAMAMGAASVRERIAGSGGGVDTRVGVVAFDTPQQPLQADHVSLGDKVPEGEGVGDSQVEQTARRKRRTKAEIAADSKAADGAKEAKAEEPGALAAETPPTAQTGTNPFDTAAAPGHAAPAGTLASTRPDDSADTTVTPFQHLTRAREFIAKHGMPKYNESFAKAGLDANVMAYTAEQRALHLEALAALEGA